MPRLSLTGDHVCGLLATQHKPQPRRTKTVQHSAPSDTAVNSDSVDTAVAYRPAAKLPMRRTSEIRVPSAPSSSKDAAQVINGTSMIKEAAERRSAPVSLAKPVWLIAAIVSE